MSLDNVVSLSERIKNIKITTDNDVVQMVDFNPTDNDVHTFLMVLRQLQKRSKDEQLKLELGADYMSIKITESHSNQNPAQTMFFDITQQSRAITFDFPWRLLDVDRSELTNQDGSDVIDLFSGVVRRWATELKITK